MRIDDESSGLQQARRKVKVGSARVVATLLLSVTTFGAVGLGVSWTVVDNIALAVTPISSTAEIGALDVPIINARRAPQTLSEDVKFRALNGQLATIARRLPNESCLMVDVEGKRLVNSNPDLSLLPASNMKIVVAAVALDVLGEDFQYVTQLVGRVNGDAVEGDIYLVGGGDPLLTTANYPATESYPTFNFTRVEDLFDTLSTMGINRILGSIVADESRYDDERFTPTLGLGIKGTEVGPLGALMINDGVVTGNPIKLDHPGIAAATELTNLFRNNGIAVAGEPKIGTAPTDLSVIAEIQSVTLPGVLAEMLTNSDNNSADLLLKEIGFAETGQGTRVAGIDTTKSKLVEWGIALDGIEITDGSGLDRGNRLTCSAISSLLLRDGGFGPVGLGLAVAGRTGTLRDVLTDSIATERLRGKTGTLSGAKALSGFIPYADGLASTYSLIMNGSNVSNQTTYRPIWNALADALGGFDGSPTAEELAPKAP